MGRQTIEHHGPVGSHRRKAAQPAAGLGAEPAKAWIRERFIGALPAVSAWSDRSTLRLPVRDRKAISTTGGAKIRQCEGNSCILPRGSYLFGLTVSASSAAMAQFGALSATLAKLREPRGWMYRPLSVFLSRVL